MEAEQNSPEYLTVLAPTNEGVYEEVELEERTEGVELEERTEGVELEGRTEGDELEGRTEVGNGEATYAGTVPSGNP